MTRTRRLTIAAVLAPALLLPAGAGPAVAKSPITPGIYSAAVVPGTNPRILHRFILGAATHPVTIRGKRFLTQIGVFFFWMKEAAVPPDGIVHDCYPGGATTVSPPGLPDNVKPGIFGQNGTAGLHAFNAASGARINAANVPIVPFRWRGTFNEKTHSIKITATCAGETHTRVYKLTERQPDQ